MPDKTEAMNDAAPGSQLSELAAVCTLHSAPCRLQMHLHMCICTPPHDSALARHPVSRGSVNCGTWHGDPTTPKALGTWSHIANVLAHGCVLNEKPLLVAAMLGTAGKCDECQTQSDC